MVGGLSMKLDLMSLFIGSSAGALGMYLYKCQCDMQRIKANVREGTQAYKVRQYLESGHSITADEALKLYGIKNLSSTLDKLKKAGIEVKRHENQHGSHYSL